MKLTLLALLTGIVVGVIFSYLKFPLPAPPTMSGIAGVIGIFTGAKIFQYIKSIF
jgi:XapX domain-containing protein